MNYNIPFLPERTKKERESGLTMMMDKGLGLIETESFIQSSSEFTDFVKFGFGTALISNNVSEKIALYKNAGIKPYFGGTLFELYIVRNMFDEFRKFIDKNRLEVVEVSDGSMKLDHPEKLKYVEILSKDFIVLSEVGSKVKGVDIIEHISLDKVLWEAPNKAQQVWFIKLCGANVNLGNIASNEVVALEALRLGLRGDTFFDFLPEKLQDKKL